MKKRILKKRNKKLIVLASLLTSLCVGAAPLHAAPLHAAPLHAAPLHAAALTVATGPLLEEAMAAVEGKGEVVYAKLDAEGQLKELYVVNHFAAQGGAPITDYGAYSTVTPLSRQGNVQRSSDIVTSDVVTVETGDAPFYYQGTLEERSLPWLFTFSYSLDGEKVDPKTLSGATGALELTIEVQANPDQSVSAAPSHPPLAGKVSSSSGNPWAEKMMLQISLTFPSGTSTSLSAEGGTVAEAGSKSQVTYMVLPGTTSSTFTLKADVQDFHMPPVQIAGVPFSMELEGLIDVAKFTDSQDLRDLQDGTKKLDDGVRALADGLAQLKTSGGDLQAALEKLSEGGADLASGSEGVSDGISQYTNGVDRISGGSFALNTGADNAASGASSLAAGLGQAVAGLQTYTGGVDSYVDGITGLLQGIAGLSSGAAQVKEGADKYQAGMAQLKAAGSQVVSGSEAIQAQIDQLSALPEIDAASLTASLTTLMASLTSLQESLASFDSTQLAQLKAGAQEVKNGSKDVNDRLPELVSGMDTMLLLAGAVDSALRAVVDNLNSTLDEPQPDLIQALGLTEEDLQNPGVQKLLNYLASASAEQTAQLLSLRNSLQSLYDPQVEVRAPLANLQAGLTELNTAMGKLQAEYGKLHAGITSLESGVSGLVDGLSGVFDGLSGVLATVGDLETELAALHQFAELPGKLGEFVAGYKQFHDGLLAYVAGVEQAASGFKNDSGQDLYSGIVGLEEGLRKLAENRDAISSGGAKLTNTTQLENGFGEVKGGLEDLAAGLGDLSNGVSAYTGGVDALVKQSGELTSGVQSYTDGVSKVSTGLGAVSEAFRAYADGIGESADGAAKISEATAKLREGTSTMDTKIQELINEFLADYKGPTDPLPSFASAKNTDVSQVQFVIMTEEIPQKTVPAPDTPEAAEPGFWERLLNLFR